MADSSYQGTPLAGTGTTVAGWTITNSGATSVANSDGTITVTPTTGAVVASLNLAHANTWTGAITMSGANIALGGNSVTTTTYTISEQSVLGAAAVQFAPTTGNLTSHIVVAPAGTNRNGLVDLFRTNTTGVNYEVLRIGSDIGTTGEFTISVQQLGTGLARPLNIYTNNGATKVMSFDTASTITDYVLHTFSGMRIATANKTAAYTLTSADAYITGDATTAAFSITLPASAGNGQRYVIKKIDSSANAVTVAAAGADTIDGAATKVLSSQFASVTVWDGATGKWSIE